MFNRKPNQSDTDNNDISDSNESSDDFAPQNQVPQESQETISAKYGISF